MKKFLHEIYRITSNTFTMAIPHIIPEGNTVVPFPAPFISGSYVLLIFSSQNICDRNCIGTLLLFLCKVNKFSDKIFSLLLHKCHCHTLLLNGFIYHRNILLLSKFHFSIHSGCKVLTKYPYLITYFQYV